MDAGFLNNYFRAVAAKRLSAVEADSSISNQHEYNGVSLLKEMFGTEVQRKSFPTQFLYLSDEDEVIESAGELTWYDARYNHPTRTEWRLYYPSNDVTSAAQTGDSLFICMRPDHNLFVITARKDSIIENQLFWLFNLRPDEGSNRFIANTDLTNPPAARADFAARMILQKIGIELPRNQEDYTEILVEHFGNSFPTTKEFSEFARSTVTESDPLTDPDDALIRWYEREETMFMCMERHLIQERLQDGFVRDGAVDVDAFVHFSLSVHNRRKSRAGLSLENHLEALFDRFGLRYSRTPVTENRSKPDFIFPCIEAYRDMTFPAELLKMLGSKTTAKDRWRQVLEEADRIHRKHLITLESAISEYQTAEMISRNLQLVVPRSVHETYTASQRAWLYSVADFIEEVSDRQSRASAGGSYGNG